MKDENITSKRKSIIIHRLADRVCDVIIIIIIIIIVITIIVVVIIIFALPRSLAITAWR